MTRPTAAINWPALLGTVALVLLGLMAWELRWVLMVLFGAIVLAVALDVPVQLLLRRMQLGRPAALTLVLIAFGSLATVLVLLLLPEVIDQVQTLIRILPALLAYLASLSGRVPALSEFQETFRSLSNFETLQPLGSQLQIGRAHV